MDQPQTKLKLVNKNFSKNTEQSLPAWIPKESIHPRYWKVSFVSRSFSPLWFTLQNSSLMHPQAPHFSLESGAGE